MRISDWSSDVCSSDLNRRSGPSAGTGVSTDTTLTGSQGRPGGGHRRERTSIRRYMAELSAGQQSLFQPVAHKEIARLSNDLEYWIKAAENLTLQNLFEKIVQRRSEEHTSELQSLMRIS